MMCNICASSTIFFAKASLLNKYSVTYFCCENCNFVQTETPYWLHDAYSDAITKADIGLVNRNLILTKITKAIITAFFKLNGHFLDYGSGYGLFVRLMRDRGYDFYWYDKYCDNLFAKTFDVKNQAVNSYELLTAFEVFEHLEIPASELEQMLTYSQNILFTTTLLPEDLPQPDKWWYYGLEHGQHISLYTYRSLIELGKRFNLNLYSDGNSIHLFTKENISAKLFRFLCKYKVAFMFDLATKRPSLLPKDYRKITGHSL